MFFSLLEPTPKKPELFAHFKVKTKKKNLETLLPNVLG